VPRADYISVLRWNAITQTPETVFVPGFQFNPVATNPAPLLYPSNVTATTTDARGYIDTNTVPGGAVPPDGVKMLYVDFYVYGADSFVQAQLTNQNASMIGQTQIGGYLNGNPATPAQDPAGNSIISFNQFQLLAWDEVGAQFPGGY
jgi:hypothetical protein